MQITSLTNPSHTANSYQFYVLIVLQKNRLIVIKKKERLIVMTMTRRILEILSFVVHFYKESSKSYVSIIVMQSELPSVNLLFIFFHK
jgi:hypothetical protein